MSFRLHKQAHSFFRNLLPGGTGIRFDTQFDIYYYCLMCGLDRRQLGAESDVGEEFVRDYVQGFQPHAELIAGLLVDAELVRIDIKLDDVKDVEKKMIELLEPASATRLSSVGHGLLNRYAAGGFNIVSDAFAAPPQSLEDFFVTYQSLWSRPDNSPAAGE